MPPRDTPLSLWHGLAATWHSRVAQHVLDTATATMAGSLNLQRELGEARSLSEVAAAQGAATRRLMETFVERTAAFSELSTAMGQEFAASIHPAPEPTSPPPAE